MVEVKHKPDGTVDEVIEKYGTTLLYHFEMLDQRSAWMCFYSGPTVTTLDICVIDGKLVVRTRDDRIHEEKQA